MCHGFISLFFICIQVWQYTYNVILIPVGMGWGRKYIILSRDVGILSFFFMLSVCMKSPCGSYPVFILYFLIFKYLPPNANYSKTTHLIGSRRNFYRTLNEVLIVYHQNFRSIRLIVLYESYFEGWKSWFLIFTRSRMDHRTNGQRGSNLHQWSNSILNKFQVW